MDIVTVDGGTRIPSGLIERGLAGAIRACESVLVYPTVNAKRVIGDLLRVEHLFGFVVSAISESAFATIRYCIVHELFSIFKTGDVSKIVPTSLAYQVLSNLSLVLLRAPYPPDYVPLSDLEKTRGRLELVWRALQVIPDLVYCFEETAMVSAIEDDFRDCEHFRVKSKKTHWRADKRVRRLEDVDTTPFTRLCLVVPTSKAELERMIKVLVVFQRVTLLEFFLFLRDGSLRNMFARMYLSSRAPAQTHLADERDEERRTNLEPIRQDVPSEAFLFEQTAELADVTPVTPLVPSYDKIHFYVAEDLGEWKIIMEPRFKKFLEKADGRIRKILRKKLWELSHGQFSKDNQKRLLGNTTEIPIYEAKMTRNTRLIVGAKRARTPPLDSEILDTQYQVDCIYCPKVKMDLQMLHIIDVSNHTQLERGIWDYVEGCVAKGGKEYKKRCTYRKAPYHKGDKVVPSASFSLPIDWSCEP
ncbi:hypothetical protein CERSUDRAFT_89981 [Gelatoporia subvermispora B]|uniref:Uncharacterized protein n=1 Tax=Ceriporiopsis subvermispora (strain B) TaxID=914234 RepID=M2RAI7_CERS8|nr:hypothetical protein CERSUDRAFT_89981 [Gelatoporia subvermispora B]